MKKCFFLTMILVGFLALGLTFLGCDNGTTSSAGSGGNNGTPTSGSGGGTLTITDIPSKYNGKYVVFGLWGKGYDKAIGGFKSINTSTYTMTLVQISNGSASLPMWDMTNNPTGYYGNDSLNVLIDITNSATFDAMNPPAAIDAMFFTSVQFTNGSGGIVWTAGSPTDPDSTTPQN